jgi:hypothetical protein
MLPNLEAAPLPDRRSTDAAWRAAIGNGRRLALATLLGIDLETVPNFVAEMRMPTRPGEDEWLGFQLGKMEADWLASRGYTRVTMMLFGGCREIRDQIERDAPNAVALVSGESFEGKALNTIIAEAGQNWFDPSGLGLRPFVGNFLRVDFLTPFMARRADEQAKAHPFH